jgi:hypothetical protein
LQDAIANGDHRPAVHDAAVWVNRLATVANNTLGVQKESFQSLGLCAADIAKELEQVEVGVNAYMTTAVGISDEEEWAMQHEALSPRGLKQYGLDATIATSIHQLQGILNAAEQSSSHTMDVVIDGSSDQEQPLDTRLESEGPDAAPDQTGLASLGPNTLRARWLASRLTNITPGFSGARLELDTEVAPAGWECPARMWRDGACDCACGLWDPDCDRLQGYFLRGIVDDDRVELLDEARTEMTLSLLDKSLDGRIDAAELASADAVLTRRSRLKTLARRLLKAGESDRFRSNLWFVPSRCENMSSFTVGRACKPVPVEDLQRAGLFFGGFATYEPGCVRDDSDSQHPRGVCALAPSFLQGAQCHEHGACDTNSMCEASEANSWDWKCRSKGHITADDTATDDEAMNTTVVAMKPPEPVLATPVLHMTNSTQPDGASVSSAAGQFRKITDTMQERVKTLFKKLPASRRSQKHSLGEDPAKNAELTADEAA